MTGSNRFILLDEGETEYEDTVIRNPPPPESPPPEDPPPAYREERFLHLIEEQPPEIQEDLVSLLTIDGDHTEILSAFQAEILEVQKRFQEQFDTIYDKRRPVVERIPGFWLSALKNHPTIAATILPEDEPILQSLLDIRLEYLEVPGFTLVFHFAENEHFKNRVLKKSYLFEKGTDYTGELTYSDVVGDRIVWKKDVQEEDRESFFDFFYPPDPPKEEEDLEQTKDVTEWLVKDCEYGEIIKEKVIPYAVHWFTGEATKQEESLWDDDNDDSGEESWEGEGDSDSGGEDTSADLSDALDSEEE